MDTITISVLTAYAYASAEVREAAMADVEVIERKTEGTTDSGPKRGGGKEPLERVTVNLIPRASRALQAVSDLTNDTKTDSINRAIQIYAYLEEVTARGGTIYVREPGDSEPEKIKIF